jgi:hypothetical protein
VAVNAVGQIEADEFLMSYYMNFSPPQNFFEPYSTFRILLFTRKAPMKKSSNI